jgi:ATP-dependent protease Clp ATPase subunit
MTQVKLVFAPFAVNKIKHRRARKREHGWRGLRGYARIRLGLFN